MFKPDSRYYALDDTIYTAANGQQTVYKKRRFLPQGDTLPTVQMYQVQPEERLDLIATRLLGNPLLFWHIADANNAMRPSDLTETPGMVLRIPAPGSYQP